VHKFVRDLIAEWRRLELPFAGDTVVIAVSGGADSVSLLLAVDDMVKRKKLGLRAVAAHFNHNLRGAESEKDEEFVRELTTRLGIELAIGRGDLSKAGNLEQNARDARYEFLRQTAIKLDGFAVLTGHTINDQAETFLLNLIRGSGPDGLGGMKSMRPLEVEIERNEDGETPVLPFASSHLLLVRPLLNWAKRIDTEAFCRDLSVEYRYDTMNEDTAFKRVRIRKVLLPLLEDMNPKIIETLANTAKLMQNHAAARNHSVPASELILSEIKTLAERELFDTIRSWLKQHRGTTRRLELKHVRAIERLIFSEKSGKTAELPGGAKVIKSNGKLIYDENKVEN